LDNLEPVVCCILIEKFDLGRDRKTFLLLFLGRHPGIEDGFLMR
jgi:hypothetical protein